MIGQYNLFPIIIALIFFYLLSYFLYTDGNLNERTYKLIWNFVLIISSIILGTTGVIMVIFINLNYLPIDSTILFVHVEAGIITTLAAIFHLHIQWKPLKNLFN